VDRNVVQFHPPDGYARRPRAPRRRRAPVAQNDRAPGQQLSLAVNERQLRRRAGELHACPSCHAPVRQPCTRPPVIGEKGRQPLTLMGHHSRDELVTDADLQTARTELDALLDETATDGQT
jgi:hypothetical protein